MPCEKCGNKKLRPRYSIGNGITAAPCPICGCQNYTYPPGMKLATGGEEPHVCLDCGVPIIKPTAMRCRSCARIHWGRAGKTEDACQATAP